MLLVAPSLVLLFGARTVDVPRLKYYPGHFEVETANGRRNVPLVQETKPGAKEMAFRRDENFAVWDARGLTIRRDGNSSSMDLQDFPVSGRFFGKDEIQKTVELIRDGTRKKRADALSGAVRIGPNAYFLVRWDDRAGKPWTEALVRVPLTDSGGSPAILGRFDGLSLAYRPIDERLFLHDGKVACVVRRDNRWGLATYDPKADQFSLRPLGGTLLTYMTTGPRTATFVERTAYGTLVAGRVDFDSDYRRILCETRGLARFLDPLNPPIVLAAQDGSLRAINGETSAELRLGEHFGVARAGAYLVAWTPEDKPTRAALYEVSRWTELAAWRAAD